MSERNIIACDPGSHTGLAVFTDGVCLQHAFVSLSSFRGAKMMRVLLEEWARESSVKTLVIESQYPRPGRSYASIFGLAAYRGAVEYEARLNRLAIVRVKPDEWKRPVLRSLEAKWSASPEVKAAAIHKFAERLGVAHVPQDVADAVAMGHWFLNKGLFLS